MERTNGHLRDGATTAALCAALLLALPVLAVVAFVTRAVLFAALAAAVVVGALAWVCSGRFRTWLQTWVEPETSYKGIRLATDVALHPGHGWARLDDRTVKVGADDLLVSAIGPVEEVELPEIGRRAIQGRTLFGLRRGDREVGVRSPVSGWVVARNERLTEAPGAVNESPFDGGWTVMVGLDEPKKDRRALLRGGRARRWTHEETDRLIATASSGGPIATATMADGGAVVGDLHRHLDDRAWRSFVASLDEPRRNERG